MEDSIGIKELDNTMVCLGNPCIAALAGGGMRVLKFDDPDPGKFHRDLNASIVRAAIHVDDLKACFRIIGVGTDEIHPPMYFSTLIPMITTLMG